MSLPGESRPTNESGSDAGQPAAEEGRRTLPAWVLSALLHITIVLVLGFTMRVMPRGAADEPARAAGIVLARRTAEQVEYFDEDHEVQEDSETAATAPTAELPRADPQLIAGNPLANLPDVLGPLTPEGGLQEVLPDAGTLTQGRPPAQRIGRQIQTSIFGITGQGTKFVYVFDRSGSMSEFNQRPLRASKTELIASLRELDDIHQFQIIFYNERPQIFNPTDGVPRLMWADSRGKLLGERFVRGVLANGGTRHMEALKLAIRMRPDVIFFLTDAEEPQLTAAELDRIRRLNAPVGASIQTIQFGFGPDSGNDNFLRRMARQNQGRHVYVDIARLGQE